MSYSEDLRERALAFIKKEGNISEASRLFGICRPALYRWMKKKELGQSLKDPPPRRPWKKINPDILKELVKQHPGWEGKDYAREMGVSRNGIYKALKNLKITRKKSPFAIKNGMKESARYFYSPSGIQKTKTLSTLTKVG
jgi:transposase